MCVHIGAQNGSWDSMKQTADYAVCFYNNMLLQVQIFPLTTLVGYATMQLIDQCGQFYTERMWFCCTKILSA